MKEIILIGAGGHCKSCIDIIEDSKEFKIKGIIDSKKTDVTKVLTHKIIGYDKDLKKILVNNQNVHIAIGQIKSSSRRVKMYDNLKKFNIMMPIIKSKRSYISKFSKINLGTIIMHGVIINADVEIGINSIINTNSLIEHDVKIGNFSHISTGAKINGNVIIGNNVFVGSGAVIKEGIKIDDNSIIAANKFVSKNIKKGTIVK